MYGYTQKFNSIKKKEFYYFTGNKMKKYECINVSYFVTKNKIFFKFKINYNYTVSFFGIQKLHFFFLLVFHPINMYKMLCT